MQGFSVLSSDLDITLFRNPLSPQVRLIVLFEMMLQGRHRKACTGKTVLGNRSSLAALAQSMA